MSSVTPVRNLCLVLMLTACALAPAAADSATLEAQRAQALLPQSQRELRVVESLQVNTSNQYRMVVFHKCEAQGLEEILSLVASSRFEELWAFIPKGESPVCQWIELGAEVSAKSESASIKVDWDYLELLMAKYPRLYLYHFHPLEYFRSCARGPECSKRSVPLRAGEAAVPDLVVNLQYAMPSAEDIYFMSECAWRLDQHHPTGFMRHRVVSPYGMVEYSLSDSGKRKYAENRGSRMEGLYIKLIAANSLADDHVQKTLRDSSGDVKATLRRLVASMNSANLGVTFQPFD